MKNRFGFSIAKLFVVAIIACLFAWVAPALAGDIITKTLIKDELKADVGGTIDTGLGTFKIGGTTVTATAAQLNAVSDKGTTGITNVVPVTAAITATGTVSITKQTYVLPAILADGTTNGVAIVTNATATATINVLNGGVVVTNLTLFR